MTPSLTSKLQLSTSLCRWLLLLHFKQDAAGICTCLISVLSLRSFPWDSSENLSVLHAVVLVMLIQYTQKIGQKSEEMRGLAGKPVLMEKNFRTTICSRTCCQCWGQKYFNVTAHGHPLDHRLSHFPGLSGNFSCQFPVPRGEALAGLQCSVASSYALQLERAIWPQRRFYADTTANWCYRPQVLP